MDLTLAFAKSTKIDWQGKVYAYLMVALVASATLFAATHASLASNIYDARIMQRMTFSSSQRPKVRVILHKSEREVAAIFRKYGINPNAKPDFDKLQRAGDELQAVESREKRAMKEILTKQQYKTYIRLLRETSARIIKATRTKP